MTTLTDLTAPTFPILAGTVYEVVPGEGPLLYWRHGAEQMQQHDLYHRDYRPTQVTAIRHTGGGGPGMNVRVWFRDDRDDRVETWVHHSFLRPVGVHTVNTVTDKQKADVVTTLMRETIWSENWANSGSPSDWTHPDEWMLAGNLAVLHRREDIEAGNISAGQVWCEAADSTHHFTYGDETCDFIHQWFVDKRERIDLRISALTPVAATTVERPRIPGERQSVWNEDGTVSMVLGSDTHGPDRVQVFTHSSSRVWSNVIVPLAGLRFLIHGDRLRQTESGVEAVYIREYGDTEIVVRPDGATGHVNWDRNGVVVIGEAPPVQPIVDLFITVGGIEYVRKDVIDDDMAAAVGILHPKSVEHSLCSVYDETQRLVDRSTTYLKMGERFKTYEVTLIERVEVRRTITMERQTNEEEAIRQARRAAQDTPIRDVSSSRRGDTTRVMGRTLDDAATARVVS